MVGGNRPISDIQCPEWIAEKLPLARDVLRTAQGQVDAAVAPALLAAE
jgi:hypothetical protein